LNVEELDAILKSFTGIDKEDVFVARLTTACAGDVPDGAIFPQLKDYWEKAKLPVAGRLLMLIVLLFTDPRELLNVIVRRRSLLIRALPDDSSQRDFLSIMSKYLCQDHPEYLTSAPIVFYTLFENEICEEVAFKAWEKRPSSRFEEDKAKAQEIRRLMQGFIKWLDEAELEPQELPNEANEEEDGGGEDDAAGEEDAAPEKQGEAGLNVDDI
jgi:hypothetical protein